MNSFGSYLWSNFKWIKDLDFSQLSLNLSHSHRLSSFLEVLGSLSEVSMAHEIMAIHHLCALLHQTFSLLGWVRHLYALSCLIIPINVELCDSGFFSENMSGQAGNVWLGWRIFIHLHIVVFNVDIIANTKKLLVVSVWTSKKDGSDTNDILLWQHLCVWSLSL